MTVVKKNLENAESKIEKTEDEYSKLMMSIEEGQEINMSLKDKITRLEKDLEEEKINSLNVQKTLSRYVKK